MRHFNPEHFKVIGPAIAMIVDKVSANRVIEGVLIGWLIAAPVGIFWLVGQNYALQAEMATIKKQGDRRDTLIRRIEEYLRHDPNTKGSDPFDFDLQSGGK